MKIYCKITKELFGFINFERPQFRFFPGEVKFAIVKYCYVFPQKMNTWREQYRIETMYYFLFFRFIVKNVQKQNDTPFGYWDKNRKEFDYEKAKTKA